MEMLEVVIQAPVFFQLSVYGLQLAVMLFQIDNVSTATIEKMKQPIENEATDWKWSDLPSKEKKIKSIAFEIITLFLPFFCFLPPSSSAFSFRSNLPDVHARLHRHLIRHHGVAIPHPSKLHPLLFHHGANAERAIGRRNYLQFTVVRNITAWTVFRRNDHYALAESVWNQRARRILMFAG